MSAGQGHIGCERIWHPVCGDETVVFSVGWNGVGMEWTPSSGGGAREKRARGMSTDVCDVRSTVSAQSAGEGVAVAGRVGVR